MKEGEETGEKEGGTGGRGKTEEGQKMDNRVSGRDTEGRMVRWPREPNALQLKNTHANKRTAGKFSKRLHQFDNM